MLLGQYIKRNMPDAVELNDMISRPGEGYAISQMAVAPVDTGALRMHVKAYANGPDGPYLEGRLALYHQVHELFALLAAEPSNKGMKGYELKDSFIGGEEADLIMLTVSHEERSQEDIAYNVCCAARTRWGSAVPGFAMACVSAACAWPRSLGIAANSGPRYTRWRCRSI